MNNLSEYTSVSLCPTTKKQLTNKQRAYSDGVCPHCGHVSRGTYTHEEKVSGRWTKPTLWQRLRGDKPEFIRGCHE